MVLNFLPRFRLSSANKTLNTQISEPGTKVRHGLNTYVKKMHIGHTITYITDRGTHNKRVKGIESGKPRTNGTSHLAQRE